MATSKDSLRVPGIRKMMATCDKMERIETHKPTAKVNDCRMDVRMGIADNVEVLPKVGRKSATATPKHKTLIVALMLKVGWSAPLLAIHC